MHALTVYFSLQVKNKLNCGIALPAFILVTCMFKNSSIVYPFLKLNCHF
jgi:hypothetical protein